MEMHDSERESYKYEQKMNRLLEQLAGGLGDSLDEIVASLEQLLGVPDELPHSTECTPDGRPATERLRECDKTYVIGVGEDTVLDGLYVPPIDEVWIIVFGVPPTVWDIIKRYEAGVMLHDAPIIHGPWAVTMIPQLSDLVDALREDGRSTWARYQDEHDTERQFPPAPTEAERNPEEVMVLAYETHRDIYMPAFDACWLAVPPERMSVFEEAALQDAAGIMYGIPDLEDGTKMVYGPWLAHVYPELAHINETRLEHGREEYDEHQADDDD